MQPQPLVPTETDPFEELLRRVFLEPRRVFVDDMTEDQRVEREKVWLIAARSSANATSFQYCLRYEEEVSFMNVD